ncbi:enoyl-CoA hydratase-related protein [Antrihabitans sp. YC2-6]|uniref:enoyl-CoA hydratase-related protein n=1 Tax=Antrihabitans sp. YC2-6 TaxID=2799498 RepID=UPI0018F66CA5|nr:enoyl-CoA hydratase-related protein [Antrihabitans sp. YC2-6]MBJ8346808.1 enoyl-CoA hydratase/isomerase family protein [Antrihabitans sp. YC2-6]
MTAEPGAVRVELDGGVALVTLDRQHVRNAIDIDTMEEFADRLEALASDETVRCVLLTGAGRAFCTGADLSDDVAKLGPVASNRMLGAVARVVTALTSMPKPVVGAVNGPAAGVGASFAFACDLVVASRASYFLLPFTARGIMPDGGATLTVAASIGRARAIRLALRGERVPAQDAFDWGLIAEVCEPEELSRVTGELARELAAGPRAAYASTKAAINALTIGDLGQALAVETRDQLTLLAAADFREGVDSFLQKRPPVFTD